jgi:hypothetical protein
LNNAWIDAMHVTVAVWPRVTMRDLQSLQRRHVDEMEMTMCDSLRPLGEQLPEWLRGHHD